MFVRALGLVEIKAGDALPDDAVRDDAEMYGRWEEQDKKGVSLISSLDY